jgi:hypothetical protein
MDDGPAPPGAAPSRTRTRAGGRRTNNARTYARYHDGATHSYANPTVWNGTYRSPASAPSSGTGTTTRPTNGLRIAAQNSTR